MPEAKFGSRHEEVSLNEKSREVYPQVSPPWRILLSRMSEHATALFRL
jgi:hypothetical protein